MFLRLFYTRHFTNYWTSKFPNCKPKDLVSGWRLSAYSITNLPVISSNCDVLISALIIIAFAPFWCLQPLTAKRQNTGREGSDFSSYEAADEAGSWRLCTSFVLIHRISLNNIVVWNKQARTKCQAVNQQWHPVLAVLYKIWAKRLKIMQFNFTLVKHENGSVLI